LTFATTHEIICGDSRKMDALKDDSIDLVVTSPPYPMISMWDGLFSDLNPEIIECIDTDGQRAFEMMHRELDRTWAELERVVKPGGIVCINIGDATRKIGETFSIYPNHSRITAKMMELGFEPLPELIWHKQTNAPNKFMGSGMLPGGAYVTLEHEYILIFRKSGKRDFKGPDKELRQNSAYFWEERNEWFSDIWDFKGEKQSIRSDARDRSAAFPCELPKRLILMYSLLGDTVLDPFFGTGTTTKAAMIFGRNSVGYEISQEMIGSSKKDIVRTAEEYPAANLSRLERHLRFVEERIASGKEVKHINANYGIPVMTSQEENILLYGIQRVEDEGARILVEYSPIAFDADRQSPVLKGYANARRMNQTRLFRSLQFVYVDLDAILLLFIEDHLHIDPLPQHVLGLV